MSAAGWFLAGYATGGLGTLVVLSLCRAASTSETVRQIVVEIELPEPRDEGRMLLDEIAEGYELARMAEMGAPHTTNQQEMI